MPISLIVTRYGGIMATKPKIKTFELDQLDSQTRAAVEKVVDQAPPVINSSKRVPDGYVYSFELEGGHGAASVELRGSEVPESLRKLLP